MLSIDNYILALDHVNEIVDFCTNILYVELGLEFWTEPKLIHRLWVFPNSPKTKSTSTKKFNVHTPC